MTFQYELIDEVETGDALGEGLIWDARSGEFLWTDIEGRRLHAYDIAARRLVTLSLEARLGCFGLTDNPDILIAAFDRGIAWLDRRSGKADWVLRPDLPSGVRFNDGRVGPDRRFWPGTMVEDAEAAGGTELGHLYRLDPDMTLTQHISGIQITNGLCWSADGKTLFHADSPKRRIRAYPFDMASGTLGTPRDMVVRTENGFPDGAIADADGLYLSAHWEGSRVQAYDFDGHPAGDIPLPTSLITCPTFGGENLDLLAVTTAHVDLSDERREQQPRAGNLFIFRTSLRGQPTPIFAGKP